MMRRPFLGFMKPKLGYTLLHDVSAGPMETVAPPETAVYFVDRPYTGTSGLAVKEGDSVLRGEPVTPYEDSDASVVPAVSGTISAIGPYTDAAGRKKTRIDVKRQGDDWGQGPGKSPDLATAARYLENLPGGMSWKPFMDKERPVDTLVVLAMDQDLLVTAVQHAVKSGNGDVAKGIAAIQKITGVSDVVAVVPSSLANEASSWGATVKVAPSSYPSARPRLVLAKLLGKVVPAGKEFADVGVAVVSAEAVAAVGAALESGKVPGEKVVTLIGKDPSARPVNYRVRVGTPVADVLAAGNILAGPGDRVVLGGPMLGRATYSLDLPVEPDTDAILVQDAETLPEILDNACVNCGDCVRACPANIQVNMLVRFLENGLYEEAADRYDLLSCVECGLCSFVCPAQIPIFQYVMLGKTELAKTASEA